jgi:hypothetical protein
LIEAIWQILNESNTTWTFKHVKGHQDRFAKKQDLDIWAKLNIIADEEAKKKVTQICNYPQLLENRPTLLPNEKCRVYITTERGHTRTKISSQLVKTGEEAIHWKRVRKYWMKKLQINNYNAQSIDWELGEISSKKLTKSRQKWLAKWITGICGVGTQLKQWKHQDQDKCPRCEQDREDVQHVMKCQHPTATIVWDDAMKKLENWMIKNECEPRMKTIIVESLQSWRNDIPYQPIQQTRNAELKKAIWDQERIGWDKMLFGFISINWRKVQTEYMAKHMKLHSPIIWMAKLQKTIMGNCMDHVGYKEHPLTQ